MNKAKLWDAIALRYGTDKASSYHDYLCYYAEHLGDHVVETVLEIGVKEGASLKMWRDIFPNAVVMGIDIAEASQLPGFNVSMTDAGDALSMQLYTQVLAEQKIGFDLIVDDGSHQIEDVLTSLNVLWDFVRRCGYYVIEDVNKSNVAALARWATDHLAQPMIYHSAKTSERIIFIQKPY